MRAVVQRVSSASVTVNGTVIAQIQSGLLVLLGVQAGDTHEDAFWLAQKIARLRIFEDAAGRMNLSIGEGVPGPDMSLAPQARREILVVSQFTLLASTRKGTRPSFNDAAKPEEAVPLYQHFIEQLDAESGIRVVTGEFGARMDVALVNQGPVTLIIDSRLRE